MNARFIPAAAQPALDPQDVSTLLTENELMFAALQVISNTDCRYALDMRGTAASVINHVLEARIDRKIEKKYQEAQHA
jgi:hypothetical protein